MEREFWRRKPLAEMAPEEWEALCDGCGRCCLLRIQDEDTDAVYYTNVVCRLLDQDDCRCTDYSRRAERVPDCLSVTPELAREPWLPSTCAYRLLAEGRSLPDWHPLISRDPGSVHQAGFSVRGRVVSEDEADDPLYHLTDWPD